MATGAAAGGGALAGLRVRVLPGAGLVARHPGSLLVVPAWREGQETTLSALLTLTEAGGGRPLARRVAGLLAATDPDEVPPLALLTDVAGATAVLVSGEAEVVVHRAAAEPEVLRGTAVATWVDRVVADAVGFSLGAPGAGAVPPPDHGDLLAGVVPGSGAVLAAGPAAGPADAAVAADAAEGAAAVAAAAGPGSGEPEPATLSVPVAPASAAAPVPAAAPAPSRGPGPLPAPGPLALIDLTQPVEPLAPLPVADAGTLPGAASPGATSLGAASPGAASLGAEPAGVLVTGVLCAAGHLNDPRGRFCSACGRSLVHVTHAPVEGPRPPLGVLVLDDGSVVTLDADYVLGREPEYDDRVLSGRSRPLRLDDPEDLTSRVHAEVRLRGWDVLVTDRRSANGTLLAEPGADTWRRLTPGEPVALRPGSRLRLGGRGLQFESRHFL